MAALTRIKLKQFMKKMVTKPTQAQKNVLAEQLKKKAIGK
jgi:hypothetical protein